MFRQTWPKTSALLALTLAGATYALTASYFGRELLMEIAILAILAMSLDLAAGYGGMISLCHGALMGLGAYGYAIATVKLGWSAPAGLALGVAAAALFAGLIGAITARAQGIFFIMATLAFGQMAYVFVFKNAWLGGSDGMPGVPRLDLSAIGVNLGDSRVFALLCLLCAVAVYGLCAGLLRSGFGRTLVGLRANEARMRALGLSVWRVKAAAFAMSGAGAGLAGALAAQQTQFVSPGLLFWTVSGEALVVVILGGMGTLIGPALGAALLVTLRHQISLHTDHWHIVVGLALIGAVLAGGRGLFGEIERRWARRDA